LATILYAFALLAPLHSSPSLSSAPILKLLHPTF